MTVRLVGVDGRRVAPSAVMLHHINFSRLGRPRYSGPCLDRRSESFYGTGEERQELRLPRGYGYRVRRHDRWWLQAMLMSHQLRAQTVRIEYRLDLVKRRQRPVHPFWIRASGCRVTYPIGKAGPAGSLRRRSWTWRVPLSGRIVAAGGHLHGGAVGLALRQPSCRRRTLVDTDPLYGRADHPVYRARPILHEPGPIATRYTTSRAGIAVRRGERLRLTATYDGAHPRARVMSIMHVYVAAGRVTGRRCRRLPADRRGTFLGRKGRRRPPFVEVPLNGIDRAGRPREIATLPGRSHHFGGDAVVRAVGGAFTPRKLSLPRGARLTWRFDDPVGHNVLYASGPRVIGAPTLLGGKTRTLTLRVPGTYRTFCYLHPLTMHEEIVVRPR